MIYKLFFLWGPKMSPQRTRISETGIFVGTFCPHNVGFTRNILSLVLTEELVTLVKMSLDINVAQMG